MVVYLCQSYLALPSLTTSLFCLTQLHRHEKTNKHVPFYGHVIYIKINFDININYIYSIWQHSGGEGEGNDGTRGDFPQFGSQQGHYIHLDF